MNKIALRNPFHLGTGKTQVGQRLPVPRVADAARLEKQKLIPRQRVLGPRAPFGRGRSLVSANRPTAQKAATNYRPSPRLPLPVRNWSLQAEHIRAEENELGLVSATVECLGMSHTALVVPDHLETIQQFAAEIAESSGVPIDKFDRLPELIRDKLGTNGLPSAEVARKTVAEFLGQLPTECGTAVRDAVGDNALLSGLAVLANVPSGEIELFFRQLEKRGCRPSDLKPLKSAFERVRKANKTEERSRPSPLPGSAARYIMADEGIRIVKNDDEGSSRLLTTFTAEILEDIDQSDGTEDVNRVFKIRGKVEGTSRTFRISAHEFSGMRWPVDYLGAAAVVYPGNSNEQHARAAIQICSKNILKRTIYTHTGWAQVGGETVYLHSGGAIGPNGTVPGVEVDLRGELSRYCLPAPPESDELRRCIRGTLDLRRLAPLTVTCCLEGATFRAALGGECDAAIWLSGRTGNGKSELSARYQQHFGAKFDRKSLPGSWGSTGNALEAAAHCAKDALFVADDFCPRGTQNERSTYHKNADRVIRAHRNKAGRQRMAADGRMRETKTPRCFFMGTGEDVPEGQSLRASMMILELGPNELQFDKLARFQKLGSDGVFAGTMAGYLRWLASRYETLRAEVDRTFIKYREQAVGSGTHKRTPELVANLMTGTHFFLQFAKEAGTIDKDEHATLLDEAWKAIGNAAQLQAEHQEESDCASRFLSLLRSAIANGRAHIKPARGWSPSTSQLAVSLGWETSSMGGRTARGAQIGWYEKDDIYLDLNAAISVAQELGRNGTGIAVTQNTLSRRLRDGGHLASSGDDRQRITIRKKLGGIRHNVLHLKLETLLGDKPRCSAE